MAPITEFFDAITPDGTVLKLEVHQEYIGDGVLGRGEVFTSSGVPCYCNGNDQDEYFIPSMNTTVRRIST